MLHILSYDLHGTERDYSKLHDELQEVVNGLGDAYFCLGSTVFLSTAKSAGAVDSALRVAFEDKISFVVVDITGIDEEKYFGYVKTQSEKGNFWDWVLAHKDL